MSLIDEGRENGLTIAQACYAVNIAEKTYRNWLNHGDDYEDGRHYRTFYDNPKGYTWQERQSIINRFCREDVVNLSLKQAYFKVLDESHEYWCSESTLYRIFKEAKLDKKRAPVREARNRYKPTSYEAKAPNAVWSWDITYFRTSQYTGKFYYAYVIVDIYSRFVISAKVYDADNAQYAKEFLGDAFIKQNIRPNQLVVHSDNGASMKATSTLSLLSQSGVTFSHSRPRVSNDNPYSESFFRTLKYSGDYHYPAHGFKSVQEAQHWLDGFVRHYNEEHRHKGIRMVTPGSRFRGEDKVILRRRKHLIDVERKKHPERWIQGRTLCCEPVKTVWLNPDNGQLEQATKENPPAEPNLQGGGANIFAGTRSRTAPIRAKEV